MEIDTFQGNSEEFANFITQKIPTISMLFPSKIAFPYIFHEFFIISESYGSGAISRVKNPICMKSTFFHIFSMNFSSFLNNLEVVCFIQDKNSETMKENDTNIMLKVNLVQVRQLANIHWGLF